MPTDTERREVEAWGLGTIIALRDLSCGEWEQPVSLFSKTPGKARKPPWWDECSNVWLVPSDRPGRVWACATDGQAACAVELNGRWRSGGRPAPIPMRLVRGLEKKSPMGGVRAELCGGSVALWHLHKGYTGVVGDTPIGIFPACEPSEGMQRFLLGMRERPEVDGGVSLSCSPAALSRGLAALSSACWHSFYSPATIWIGESDAWAWNGKDGGNRCVMRCAARRKELIGEW